MVRKDYGVNLKTNGTKVISVMNWIYLDIDNGI